MTKLHAVGLVTEYNPFHNGHLYHLTTAKRQTGADVVVAVMSGNFTQRGEPTILDKWTRAQAALANGVDLVVELPVFHAVQPAHRFAAGALQLLDALQVEQIVFGAEHPEWDFDQLVAAEAQFDPQEFHDYHATYASQFNAQLAAQTGYSLTDPNDILAFSYYKARHEAGYQFDLQPMQRIANHYHQQTITGTIASASAIRQAVQTKQSIDDTVPEATAAALAQLINLPDWETLYPILRNQLIQTPVQQLAQYYQMGEGIEYRMQAAAERALTFADFIKQVKTKRYTYAYLTRLCLYVTLGITKSEVANAVANPYLHVLGFSDQGQAYLSQIKKTVTLPLIVKVDQDLKAGVLKLDYRAGKLYQMFTPVEQDLKHAPIRRLSRK